MPHLSLEESEKRVNLISHFIVMLDQVKTENVLATSACEELQRQVAIKTFAAIDEGMLEHVIEVTRNMEGEEAIVDPEAFEDPALWVRVFKEYIRITAGIH